MRKIDSNYYFFKLLNLIICFNLLSFSVSAQKRLAFQNRLKNLPLLSNFTENQFSLFAGMNFSKQNISTGNYVSNFNYYLEDFQKNAFKPGYFAGVRMDGKFQQKHLYSISVGLHKITTGTNYVESIRLSPFLGSFSKFKAEEQFFNLSIAAHYKKLIPLGDIAKRKLYFVLGPSLDTRLSGQSNDNKVNANYHRFLLRGDLGLEFDNQSYYTLFVHYQQGLSSFTKAPISTNFNSVELGMMLKASDLF